MCYALQVNYAFILLTLRLCPFIEQTVECKWGYSNLYIIAQSEFARKFHAYA